VLKIAAPAFEMKVWIDDSDVARLSSVRNARWEDRTSICIGTTANAPAHWCSDHKTVSVLVGDDDDDWDVAVVMQLDTFDELLAAIGRERDDVGA
jgi:hypothetical protein